MEKVQRKQLPVNYWNKKNINLGTVKVGSNHEVKFISNIELDVTGIRTSCGCTGAVYNKENKTLTVKYKAKAVPRHLKRKGFYNASLSCVVTHKEGNSVLTFKAIVKG